MAVADLHGHLLRVNRHLCRLLGRDEEDLIQHWISDVLLPDVPDSPETDGPVRRVRRLVRRDGSVLPAMSTSWVIPAAAGRPARRMYEIQGPAEPGTDVPPAGDTDIAPRLAMQLARLQSATARLSRVRSMIEVATVILDETTDSIGADRAALWAIGLEGRTLDLLGSRNYPDGMVEGVRRLPLFDRSPATEALRSRQPVLLPSPEFPDLGDVSDTATSFTVPLYIESRPIGILSFAWRQFQELADVDRRFILALGDQCALALDRARLFEGEKRAIQRQQFLAEASRVLSESLDFSATATQIARLPVPQLADSCSVMVMDETDRLHAVAHAHIDPARLQILEDLKDRPEALPPAYLGRVAVTGEPVVTPKVTADDIDTITDDPGLRTQLRALDIRSSMTVPLRARGNTVGLLGLQMSDSGRHFSHDDRQLVLDLADRAAIALDNARTFQLRDQVAETLQQSLRPPRLPRLPGAQIAARYQPGLSGVDVGGDFYDVFDDEGDWAVVLGDVCGKGAVAAAITSMVRYSLRALAIQGHQPAVILGWLNETMTRQSRDEERFCTVAYARLVPTAGGLRVTVCSGGHPLPMIVRANGRVSPVGAAGGLIGLFPDVRLLEETTELLSGDALVLYTDGVTEAHQGSEQFGEERLAQVLAAHAGADAEEMASAIEQAVDQFATPSRRDDLALLILRVD
jgi:serine phosphatase RsbU (regulator of sigma subunit)